MRSRSTGLTSRRAAGKRTRSSRSRCTAKWAASSAAVSRSAMAFASRHAGSTMSEPQRPANVRTGPRCSSCSRDIAASARSTSAAQAWQERLLLVPSVQQERLDEVAMEAGGGLGDLRCAESLRRSQADCQVREGANACVAVEHQVDDVAFGGPPLAEDHHLVSLNGVWPRAATFALRTGQRRFNAGSAACSASSRVSNGSGGGFAMGMARFGGHVHYSADFKSLGRIEPALDGLARGAGPTGGASVCIPAFILEQGEWRGHENSTDSCHHRTICPRGPYRRREVRFVRFAERRSSDYHALDGAASRSPAPPSLLAADLILVHLGLEGE